MAMPEALNDRLCGFLGKKTRPIQPKIKHSCCERQGVCCGHSGWNAREWQGAGKRHTGRVKSVALLRVWLIKNCLLFDCPDLPQTMSNCYLDWVTRISKELGPPSWSVVLDSIRDLCWVKINIQYQLFCIQCFFHINNIYLCHEW